MVAPFAATGCIANRISWEYPLASPSPQTFQIPSLRETGHPSRSIPPTRRRTHLMPIDSRAIVRRLYEEAWNRRKLELVSDLISPSHALHNNNSSGSSVGPEAYKALMALYLAAFPDLRFTVEDTVAEKDKVAASWSISGTHK